jgi:hypothetical protein
LISFRVAVAQGACVFPMMGKPLKVTLGGSAIAVASSSFLHSDPVRILLTILAGVCANIFLYLIWNGWHLRNPPQAWSVVW